MSFMRVSEAQNIEEVAPVDLLSGATLAAPLPTYTNDQISNFLVYNWLGGASFNTGAARAITVNITALTVAGQQLATWALEAWTMVTGITFNQTGGAAQITFDDNQPGAFAGPSSYTYGGTINTSTVNVSTSWLNNYGTGIDSYSFMTYMHEIGHAMGLDHAGRYDGNATYITQGPAAYGNNHYLNDSWQTTVMSYFDQVEAGTGTFNYLLTPMIADILAMQTLYGVAGTLRTGDTVYGVGSTAGGYYDANLGATASFTIIDNGGIDKINFSNVTADQRVDLNPETISDVGGLVGNMIIMRDTIIEQFFSGSGNDTITGNVAANLIDGGGGIDLIKGKGGVDTIYGGAGDDILNGNAKGDKIYGGVGNDILRGGNGKDKLFGGDDNDTLMGGIGRDRLTGGQGNDTFVFKAGWAVDLITDFEDNIDTLSLDSALWGGGLSVTQVIATYGTSNVANINGNGGFHVELNFGGGDIIKIHGITDVNALFDDITIF